MEQQIFEANLNEIKYKMMKTLESIILGFDGIIFGGYVRDTYIHNHYAQKFYENSENIKYSNPENDLDTKNRLLVAKDIDVFLKGNNIQTLYDKFTASGFHVISKETKTMYFDNKEIFQQKSDIRLNNMNLYGMPNVTVSLDVLYTTNDTIEPCFGKLDLMCNCLIMYKNGIRLSTQTGTELDNTISYTRKMLEMEILNDILQLKTDIAKSLEERSIKDRKLQFLRAFNMQLKGWKINNCIYEVKTELNKLVCDLCDQLLSKKYVHLNCCGCKVHTQCFEKDVCSEYKDENKPHCPNTKCDVWEKKWLF